MPELPRPDVAVVAALPEEIAPLRRILGARPVADRAGTWRARVAGVDLVLAVTGDGRTAAERGLTQLLADHRPERLLGIGLAGALTPGLEIEDLVVANQVIDGEEIVAAPDLGWLETARSLPRYRLGRVVTVNELVLTAEEKTRHRGEPHPLYPPTVVDLESAVWARGAAAANIPYLVVRVVSDRADESLPPLLAACVRPDDGVDRRLVLRQALSRPHTWGDLLLLASRAGRCARRLADFAEAVVRAVGRQQSPT